MYTMEQIQTIINNTPNELKGRKIDDLRPRAFSTGRRIDRETHHWFMVYMVWEAGGEPFSVVVMDGIIK